MMSFKKDTFLIGYLVLLLVFLYPALLPQMEVSQSLNKIHNPVLDQISLYGTYIGDGWFCIILAVVIWYFNTGLFLRIILAYGISAGITQGLKHLVFDDSMRPMWHLARQQLAVHIPEGAEHVVRNSFPSGHTTSAFALFSILALNTDKKFVKLLFLFLAVFAAFTRIYLFQHFLIDTLAGSWVGASVSYILFYVFVRQGRLNRLENALAFSRKHQKL